MPARGGELSLLQDQKCADRQHRAALSQNFLTSGPIIRGLIDQSDLHGKDVVLEIGAGKGHITRELAKRCRRVIAYEIDPALCERLEETLPDNVTLIRGDFMRHPLPKGRYKVFANIPFSLTTDILRRLTDAPNPPESAWLIVERGAAMRFCGLPRESAVSLSLKPWFDVEIAAPLSREAFHPAPAVDCALLSLRKRQTPELPLSQREAWKRFTLAGLRGEWTGLSPYQARQALKREGLIPMSATLRYVQWLCLFRCERRLRGKR